MSIEGNYPSGSAGDFALERTSQPTVVFRYPSYSRTVSYLVGSEIACRMPNAARSSEVQRSILFIGARSFTRRW